MGKYPIVYAAWINDKKIRKESSSGGVFTAIAEKLLDMSYIIAGVVLDENLNAKHVLINSKEELYHMRGSKYISSNITEIYNEIKDVLVAGKKLLITGTPCQIASVKKYINNFLDTESVEEQVIYLDVLCHGVPSEEFYSDYKNYEENKHDGKLVNIDFRNKKYGWKNYSVKLEFDNGNKIYTEKKANPFISAFLKNYSLKQGCYKCPFKTEYRDSDITLGDYWGYNNKKKEKQDDNKGISLVLINTQKGKKIFDSIKKRLTCYERTIENCKRGNGALISAIDKPDDYERFIEDYKNKGFEYINIKYLESTLSIMDKIYIRCPQWIKNVLKR